MDLTIEEVKYVALLARVGMTDDELDLIKGQLSNILNQMEVLQQIPTDGVEPTGHSVDLSNVMRDDIVQPSRAVDRDILINVPDRQDDFVRILAVLE